MWVIVALASLAAFVILILCVPLDMVFRLDVPGRLKFSLRLTWLFGLVSKEVKKGKKKPEEKKRMVKGKPKLKEGMRRTGDIFEIMRTRGLLRQLKKLLMGILSRLQIRELGVNFRVGLGNPADTGLLFAVIGPATLFLGSSRFHEIRVEPSFGDEAIFEGYSYGAVRLQPIRLVTLFLRFAFSLATIRVIKRVVLTKWKRKKK